MVAIGPSDSGGCEYVTTEKIRTSEDWLKGYWLGSSTLTIRGIDTREVLVVTQTCFKYIIPSVIRSVVVASNAVEYVFTVAGGIWTSRIACLEAEDVGAYKAITQQEEQLVVSDSGELSTYSCHSIA